MKQIAIKSRIELIKIIDCCSPVGLDQIRLVRIVFMLTLFPINWYNSKKISKTTVDRVTNSF